MDTTSITKYRGPTGTTTSTKTLIRPTVGGAGRFAESILPTLSEFNRSTSEDALALRYIDRRPGKAARFAARASVNGIQSIGEDGLIEEAVFDPEAADGPIWSTVDTVRSHANVLIATATSGTAV